MPAFVIATQLLYCSVPGQKDMGGTRRKKQTRSWSAENYLDPLLSIRSVYFFQNYLDRILIQIDIAKLFKLSPVNFYSVRSKHVEENL